MAVVILRSKVVTVSSSRKSTRDGSGLVSWKRLWLGGWMYWSFQIAGWGGAAISAVGLNIVLAGRGDPEGLRFALLKAALYLVATHLLRVGLLLIRARWKGWKLVFASTVWVLLAAQAVTAILFALRWKGAMARAHPPPAHALYLDILYWQIPEFLAWVGLYFAFTNFRNYRESIEERLQLVAAVKDAELRVLKAQINPHFLFNCLNSTWAMIPRELERPRESLTLLADLLRSALTLGEKKTVPFRQEWETVQTYVALEQIRFEQRLRVRHTIDPATAEWPVPPFLLQTLVENAVKFGIRPRDDGGEIVIAAFVREATLHFRVTNPGRITATPESTGVGLKNSRARLHHLFGDDATLTLKQSADDTVVAEVTIRSPAISRAPGVFP